MSDVIRELCKKAGMRVLGEEKVAERKAVRYQVGTEKGKAALELSEAFVESLSHPSSSAAADELEWGTRSNGAPASAVEQWMKKTAGRIQSGAPRLWVTVGGIPLEIDLNWPAHHSTSGADWFVLHGRVELAGSEGLHADVACNISQAVKRALPTLEQVDAEAYFAAAIRKEADRGQLEFLKSGKRQPVQVSSRFYSIVANRWEFVKATEEQLREFAARKAFWAAKSGDASAWMADPDDAVYLTTTPEQLVKAASAHPELKLEGEFARATPALMARAAEFEAMVKKGVAAGRGVTKTSA